MAWQQGWRMRQLALSCGSQQSFGSMQRPPSHRIYNFKINTCHHMGVEKVFPSDMALNCKTQTYLSGTRIAWSTNTYWFILRVCTIRNPVAQKSMKYTMSLIVWTAIIICSTCRPIYSPSILICHLYDKNGSVRVELQIIIPQKVIPWRHFTYQLRYLQRFQHVMVLIGVGYDHYQLVVPDKHSFPCALFVLDPIW